MIRRGPVLDLVDELLRRYYSVVHISFRSKKNAAASFRSILLEEDAAASVRVSHVR
tara:strand:+ start:568 stop:735 length:168 start_codon:yes stop_codon:yes gene_type:complete